ncbi:MAG: apolipoprotein N-acyltransferase [Candidatus Omnitrophica bacterium]|nr:apolipoprotein N-acyltransferase [Candidatus Omnitrophota bacterium]
MKKSIFLSLLSGLFLSFSFSSFNLWLFGWCGLVYLFIALENKSLRQSFIIAYLCGIVFWILTIYWLIHVTLIGQAVLILYLSIYFGVFGCAVFSLRSLSPAKRLFCIPIAWVLLEYIRSYLFTGFPWSLIGLSQYKNLPVIQIADITGAWGVSFLVVLVNTAFYLILRKQSRIKTSLIISVILILSLAYGFHKLSYKPNLVAGAKPLKISVIQGNIPQDLKWDKRAVNFILDDYKELTAQAANDDPDLIIWPEASVPGFWGQDDLEFAQVFSLARQLKINLLVGAVSHFEPNYFNSALSIDKSGVPLAIYSKIHLVPLGEYIPFKKSFPFLETIVPIGDIEPGRDYTIFKQPADFSVLICFEDLFPELSRKFVKKGAQFLVNITNDAWYKEGSAPFQHFAASVFRAVENRVYLARAANTGISGFIDPFGRILSVVQNSRGFEIFVKGYSSQNIYLIPGKPTFYNRYGDLFVIFCALFGACIVIFNFSARKN